MPIGSVLVTHDRILGRGHNRDVLSMRLPYLSSSPAMISCWISVVPS
jgi:hypothetical protein